MEKNFVKGIGVALMLCLFLGSGISKLQGQEGPQSPGEHRAMAARYRKEAEETRKAIERHQMMLEIYRKEGPSNPQGRRRMVEHCERVIQFYTQVLEGLEALAQEHEALAQSPASPGSPK